MENDEKVLTGEESLKIITEMISRTRVNVRQGSFHLILWGWLILVCSLTEYFLYMFTSFENGWYVWLLTIPGVFVSLIYGYMKGRNASFHTYADMVYLSAWLAFLLSAIVLFILMSDRLESVAPYILMLAAVPTFISGWIIKFSPLITGAVAFWILAIAARFAGQEIAPLAVPVAMIAGYLIPGYLLRKKSDDVKVQGS